MEKLIFTRMNLSGVEAIMTIMCVPVGELLCQAMTRLISVLECLLSDACWLLGLHHVISYQTLNAVTCRGPGSSGVYPVLENPQVGYRGPGCVLSQG
jgi:hypothetical protein